MEKYTIHAVDYDNTKYYCVYENATEQVFDFFYFENDAISCKFFLEEGGAFDGFTPSFVLKKIQVENTLDTKFEYL